MKASQLVARKARARKLKFDRAKKEAKATLIALSNSISAAEGRLKRKAKEVSAAVERFHNLAVDGLQDDIANPHLGDAIDFSDSISEVTAAIEGLEGIEK